MSDIDEKNTVDDFNELKVAAGIVHRNIKWMILVSIVIGTILAHVFNHLNTSSHFIAAIGLYSQIIGFGAAILLSSQFMSIPERLFGVHNYAVAFVMLLPMYIWMATFIYALVGIVFGFTYSEVWALVTTISCCGLGIVVFAFGSIQEALKFEVSDKSLVLGIGWYMILFSLGLQVYLSLISLEVLKAPFGN